ncbi:maleate cis-trans isomerase family protein [Ruegeria profundi]|uniref:maleate cis-trans isomerase family protein n=1 Tax=Ruegeria profundi TaxID=1685378 RepID=UPI001CD6BBBE|nr:Asp/Glu racemase [Ruegeria profundi]MCA0926819.1 Asp/Glu racemase [Ruegeria profundi]
MSYLPYILDEDDPNATPMGLIVLQTDETIEPEFSAYFSDMACPIYVSRIPSGESVTTDSLSEMKMALPAAADLLPKARPYRVVGYGCTSASSVIGSDQVERLVQSTCNAAVVTNPLRAASANAAHLGVARFALLSPYIEEVNEPLRRAFAENGVSMDVFGSFGEAEESKVVRISRQSVVDAALKLGADSQVEAVFISCTNLRTFDVIPEVQERLGKPVLSSNQSLAWHMRQLNSAK